MIPPDPLRVVEEEPRHQEGVLIALGAAIGLLEALEGMENFFDLPIHIRGAVVTCRMIMDEHVVVDTE